MKPPLLEAVGSRAVWPSPYLIAFATSFLLTWTTCAQLSLFDETFAVGDGADGPVNSIVADPQGNIWVGGEFSTISGRTNAYLARLTTNGGVDPLATISADGPVHRLAVQSDGKVLVAGSFSNLQGIGRRGLARFHTNGTLDASFDASGILGTNLNMFTLAVQPDGKILTASEFDNVRGCQVFRLLSDGQPDPDFANTNIFAGQVFSFGLGASNAILVGGKFIGHNAFFQPGLALMQSNGVITTAWSNQLGNEAEIFTIATQLNGAVLVGGSFSLQGQPRSMLGRLTHDFVWDTNFVTDSFTPATISSVVTAILLQPDGFMVVGGNFYEVGGYWRRHLVRLSPDGKVDPCFDPVLGLGGEHEVRSFALQADGKVIIGGKFYGTDGLPNYQHIARAKPSGPCDAAQIRIVNYSGVPQIVAGTLSPGGTNHLEISTNLLNWTTLVTQTNPYVFHMFNVHDHPAACFRLRKQH